MLIEINEMHGMTIHALDGEVGRVDEILFDDKHWTVRYLIVATGSWLFGKKVLISPMAFGSLDWEKHTVNLNLTCEQIKDSPNVDTNKPVSRQWERDYYDYYAWPYYWAGVGTWGTFNSPGAQFMPSRSDIMNARREAGCEARYQADTHLRSTKEVTGYKISATDGHLGHVQDFLINEDTWRISYLGVDTRDWWPGKKVLLPPDWIEQVNWLERSVMVSVTRDQVRNAPEWFPDQPISSTFEAELYGYYARQRPEGSERVNV
jgi:sporulation protein YlmC with PRC-barrel domain